MAVRVKSGERKGKERKGNGKGIRAGKGKGREKWSKGNDESN